MELHFTNRQLQISDKRDYGCTEVYLFQP